MNEATSKGHAIGAFVILIAICVLFAWAFGLMNSGDIRTGAGPAVLLFLFGAYGILALGPAGDDA